MKPYNAMSGHERTTPRSEVDYASLKDTYACPCDESTMYDKFLMPVKANGMWVWFDGEEEPYLDLVLNYSSVNFGHCYPPIVEIAKEVIGRVDQIHSFHSKDKLELSEYLSRKVSIDEDYKVYFNIGGSAAVSDAIRGHSRLIAGCGFAVHVLKARTLDPECRIRHSVLRI